MGVMIDPDYVAAMAARRQLILDCLADALASSGRQPGSIRLAAVSKTVDVAEVLAARSVGYADFAENRPQELTRKRSILDDEPSMTGVSWHMIGNLQRNKVNAVLDARPTLIHSVSSMELARAISERCERRGIVQDVLFEVNVSGECSKSGFSPEELAASIEGLSTLAGIRPCGLMTMAPQGDGDVARRTFEGLRELASRLRSGMDADHASSFRELSMGMSEDYLEAVREGATIIRLGRLVFDPAFA